MRPYFKFRQIVLASGLVALLFAAPAFADQLSDALDNPVNLDGTPLSFATGTTGSGAAVWSAVTTSVVSSTTPTFTLTDGFAAQSGAIGNNQSTWIQTVVTGTAPASLSFYQKVSSQLTYDTLTFAVDGIAKSTISGNVNWQQKRFPVPTGTHTLRWTYKKNASGTAGSDAAWLDRVVVSPNPAVKVLSPNGGEPMISGTPATITWNAPAGAEKYDLSYTTDNGTTWKSITTGFMSSALTNITYSWTWPAVKSNMTLCKVKVVAKNSAGVIVGSDVSDKTFSINNVRITAPNGGNVLNAGTPFDITWDSAAAATRFILSYTWDNGTTWKLLTTVTGTNTYTWNPVPTPPGNKTACKVRIVAYNSSNAIIGTDLSDAPFTMQVLKVTAPNGGEILSGKTGTYTIGYFVSGLTTTANTTVSYTINGGISWVTICKSVNTVVSPTAYTCDWRVPTVSTLVKNAKVKVDIKTTTGVLLATDSSDAAFTIQPLLTISGVVLQNSKGLQGVAISLGGAEIRSATTDTNGKYSFPILLPGNYTVEAAKPNTVFNPVIKALALTTANITTANFTATATLNPTYTLSGTVSGATSTGVTLTLSGIMSGSSTPITGSIMTDVNGDYAFSNVPAGNYTLKPSKTGFIFDPVSRGVALSEETSGMNFTASAATTATYSISGMVTSNGTGTSGVLITVTGDPDATVFTDASGNYVVTGLKNNSTYTITPSSGHGYDFSSAMVTRKISGASIAGVNFSIIMGTTLGTVIPSPVVPQPITSYAQRIPSSDPIGPYEEILPGYANIWTLEEDFTLIDGFDMQFNYAEWMGVGGYFDQGGFYVDDPNGNGDVFPSDQTLSELTYYTPRMTANDGFQRVVVGNASTLSWLGPSPMSTVTGTYGAFFNLTSDSKLQQVLDLTSLPTGTAVRVGWRQAVYLDPGVFPGFDPSYQVVVRDLNGNLVEDNPLQAPILNTPSSGGLQVFTTSSKYLYKSAGKKVVLSFEARSSLTPWSTAYAIVDNVSVMDYGRTTEFVKNGDFETGRLDDGQGGGWYTNTPSEVQNITSGARTIGYNGSPLAGLTVKRSFYTAPNKLWGRWVDVFTNNTTKPISTTIAYETSLGAGSDGVIYHPAGAGSRALSIWDSYNDTRDVGLVFGRATGVYYASSTNGLVAVGQNGEVITSTEVTAVPGVTFSAVGSSGSAFVAGGQGGYLYSSADGLAWTQRSSGTAANINGVASSGTVFAAVGNNGVVLLSSDASGTAWSLQSSGTSTNLNAVTWSGSAFVAVGDAGAILTSADGVSWSLPNTSDTTANLSGVASNGAVLVAVGQGGAIVYSPDGLNWYTQTSPVSNDLSAVSTDGFQFVAVGAGGTILTSPDGTSWSTETSGSTSDLKGVAWSGTQFAAVGQGGAVLASANGATWTLQSPGTSGLNAVTFGAANAGSPYVDVDYDVTVPAGGQVVLVNFVLMSGKDTGQGSPLFGRATEIDSEAANIVNNFWTDPEYRRGMTSSQISAIQNFPK